MNKEDIIDGIKRKGSHGNVINKEAKAQESAEIEAKTKEFLNNGHNKITDGGSYDDK